MKNLNIQKYNNKRFNKKCFICEKHFYILEIHHKDRNRKNNIKKNLLIICPKCHNTIHHPTDKNLKLLSNKQLYLIKKFVELYSL